MATCRSCRFCGHIKYFDAPHVGWCDFLSGKHDQAVKIDMDSAHKMCGMHLTKSQEPTRGQSFLLNIYGVA